MNKRTALDYYVLDVFSDKSYLGNPLSVVFTEGNLDLKDYQNISKEFGYSETSFVFYDKTKKALDIRSFTPTGHEVDAGAGHNLLGAVCGALLKGIRIFDEQLGNDPFVIMKDTRLYLNVSFDEINLTHIVRMKQKPAIIRHAVPIDRLAKALGLQSEDLGVDGLLPSVVETEVAHLMVPLKSQQLLNDTLPANKQLIELSKKFGFEGFYCFALTDQSNGFIAESRFFNPLIGIDEDAATGTAAGPLTGFLAAHNYIQLNKEYKILQGVKLNHPSIIEVTAGDNGILVGGSSIITMNGQLYL